jgi:hypothetical protein
MWIIILDSLGIVLFLIRLGIVVIVWYLFCIFSILHDVYHLLLSVSLTKFCIIIVCIKVWCNILVDLSASAKQG